MGQVAATGWQRREPRYRIASGALITVTGAQCDSGAGRECHGTVSDLSQNGIRVALNACWPVGQAVVLRLQVPEIQLDLVVDGVVRTIEPRDSKTWWLGCSLVEPLTHQLIEDLAVAGVLDRRQDVREAISRSAQVQWPLSDEVTEAELTDYSRGGFGLRAAGHDPAVGEQLMLIVRSNDQVMRISARVRWCAPSEVGYQIGCSFTARDDFLLFVQALELAEPSQPSRPSARCPSPRPLRLWTGIAIIVLVSVVGLCAVSTHPRLAAWLRIGYRQFIVRPIASITDRITPKHDPNDVRER